MDIRNKQEIEHFYKAVLSLETVEECEKFFEDICTFPELEAIAQRLQVAKLLTQGKNYNEINLKTGVSTATISRVSKSLNYGEGGYQIVLDKAKQED